MDWQFDENSFIIPYTCIPLLLKEFKKSFVEELSVARRQEIFNQYEIFVDSLKSIIGEVSFYQWIDGSFLNLYSFPNDLDVVTFLPEKTFKAVGKSLNILRYEMQSSLLDLYFVQALPSDHKNFFLYQSDRLYWLHLFSYSKRNLASGKRFEKGFFKLTLIREPRRKK